MNASISPHATLEAIVRMPADPLNSQEAAECLGRHYTTINEAVRQGKIEGTKQTLRRHGSTHRYRITKAALIRWLWESESGDKQTLRSAMQDLCPRILKTLEGRDRPARQPSNVVPFAHPDLFLRPGSEQQQSA